MSAWRIRLYLGVITLLLILMVGLYLLAFNRAAANPTGAFNGLRAYQDVKTQVAFGPRVPGSAAHAQTLQWMQDELRAAGWIVEVQSLTSMGHPVQNLIARRSDAQPQILLGAHYDSRIHADRDPNPDLRSQAVPGADDGASGVAVLLELARTLPSNAPPVWLVFFDVEDNGGIPGWDWLLGSRAFVDNMTVKPREMVLLDMVGDTNLNLPMEANSDAALRKSIWDVAAALGHADVFIPVPRYSIEDDHSPFLEAGIPAADIIDIDYPYWHTTSDLPEHVSERSLQIVGDVVSAWVLQQKPAVR